MNDHILTPEPSVIPRINGAKVMGARPGNPFLFKVPATGEKPLCYKAENLPKGLSINSETGIITGAVKEDGDYRVQLIVENTYGSANREFLIKIGETICLTPPMGWNSWYCHSELISEEAIRETAQAMVDTGLVDHGWTYVNIDDCWQGERKGEDLALHANEKFKDMKGMCDFVHSLGLKPGIYSTPWIGSYAGFLGGTADNPEADTSHEYLPEEERLQPCQVFGRNPSIGEKGLNRTGKEWFLDRDAKLLAEWGFDYIKLDWTPNDVPTTKRFNEDLINSGRDIVLSLSNAAPYENAEGLAKYANAWRTTGDIHAAWSSISRIGFEQEAWQKFNSPGHWSDPDMLQVGNIGTPNRKNETFRPTNLTADEQYTQVSLWCILSAPLLLSCDIASLDEFTLSLLTNDEVLEVNQDPAVNSAKRVYHDDFYEIWTKLLEEGSTAIGLFNKSDEKRVIEASWGELGLSKAQVVRDLWRQKDMGTFEESFFTEVNSHGVVLVKVTETNA